MRKVIVLVICFLILSCSRRQHDQNANAIQVMRTSAPPASLYDPTTFLKDPFRPDSLVERITLDLNGDSKLDTVDLLRPIRWTDPGDFHFLRFSLSGATSITFKDIEGWDSLGRDCDGCLNSISYIHSKHVALYRRSDRSFLVFLLGVAYASSPGRLTVLSVSADSINLIHNGQFWVKTIADVNGDGVPDIVGKRSGSESWGVFESYQPFYIYLMPAFVLAPRSLLREYNLSHYYGFADDTTGKSFVVVHLEGKVPFVMRQDEAEKLYGQGGGAP